MEKVSLPVTGSSPRAGSVPTNDPPAARPLALSLRHGRDGLPTWKYAMPTDGFRTPRARAAGPGKPRPPSAQVSDAWLPLENENVKYMGKWLDTTHWGDRRTDVALPER
jgi:hypothetical protein